MIKHFKVINELFSGFYSSESSIPTNAPKLLFEVFSDLIFFLIQKIHSDKLRKLHLDVMTKFYNFTLHFFDGQISKQAFLTLEQY